MRTHKSKAKNPKEKIAIIGIAIRFPGANNLAEYWEIIKNATVKTRHFSLEESRQAGVSEAFLSNPDYIPVSGALENIDLFDADFFSITKKEALLMDPAQRWFLECSYHALEDAGIMAQTKTKKIGVFAGCGMTLYGLHSYFLKNIYPGLSRTDPLEMLQAAVGNQVDFIATRVAYRLGLKGAAVSMQTACSTSLVTLHLACQALLSGELDCALVGAAAVNVPSEVGYLYQPGSILSKAGQCRPFDKEADGAVGGNGVCCLAIKPLTAALEDRNRIYAVIAGSAINNDGDFKAGFAAPSVNGQMDVIQQAWDDAQIEPQMIGHIETHGTATELGDAVEIHALQQVFQQRGCTEKQSCSLGSVKANLGHLDTCAGYASLVKSILLLRHQQIPPQANYTSPLSHLRLEETSFYINTELKAWPKNKFPQKIGVSAFGFGGTNAHVILEAAPTLSQAENFTAQEAKIILISAKNDEQLNQLCQSYIDFINEQDGQLMLSDMAFTSIKGREHSKYRTAFIANNVDQLKNTIKSYLTKQTAEEHSAFCYSQPQETSEHKIAFLFAGQMSEFYGMGLPLYNHFASFRKIIDKCDYVFEKLTGDSLLPSLLTPGKKEVLPTNLSQPSLFAFEMGLSTVWEELGIRPDYVAGHSFGEYAALCYAGAFSIEEGIALVTQRGNLMQSTKPGGMLTVFTKESDLKAILQDYPEISIAVENSERHFVVSGRESEIDKLEIELEKKGIKALRLPFSRAFHSQLMQKIIPDFRAELLKVQFSPLTIPFVDNQEAREFSVADSLSPEYFIAHLQQTVKFNLVLQALFKAGCDTFIEIGPQSHLCRLGIALNHDKVWLPSQLREAKDIERLLLSLLALYCQQHDRIQWQPLLDLWGGSIISLPNYPFKRTAYWINANSQRST